MIKKLHHKSNNIVWLGIEQGGRLNNHKGMLMQIWLLMHLNVAESIEREEPQTYHEAITSRDSTQQIVAMNKEIESLQNKTVLGNQLRNLKIKRLLVANSSLKERKEFQNWRMLGSKHAWWQRATHKKRAWTSMKCFLQL